MADIKTKTYSLTTNSHRGSEWCEFAQDVLDHVDLYTVPQYGDKPDDQAEEWTIEQIVENIKRYSNRCGSNAREGQELLDPKKVAHYACLWYGKQKSAQESPKKAQYDEGTIKALVEVLKNMDMMEALTLIEEDVDHIINELNKGKN